MAITLFDLLRRTARELPGAYFTGSIDSGVSDGTQFRDAAIGGGDNSLNGGTVLFTKTTVPATQGISRVISDYDAKNTSGNGLVTLASTVGADGFTAGDKYIIIKPRYTRDFLVEMFNQEYTNIWFPQVNDTITIAANDKTYALPAGVNPDTLLQVHIAQGDSEPFDWSPCYYTHVDLSAVSDGYVLRFDEQQTVGKIVRVTYAAQMSPLDLDTDVIHPGLDIELIAVLTARAALQWRHDRFTSPPQRETNALNALLRRERNLMRRLPHLPNPFPNLPYPGRPSRMPGGHLPIPSVN